MKDIKKWLYLYTGTFALLMLASLSLFIAGADHLNLLWLLLLLPMSALAAGLARREYGRCKAARLILENRILHIRPVVIDPANKDDAALLSESMEVFVSCFGILMGTKVVKFNQEGIRLKAVEIGRTHLSIDYGTDRDVRNVRLLYARPDSAALADIIEKFRYETGVVPAVTQ